MAACCSCAIFWSNDWAWAAIAAGACGCATGAGFLQDQDDGDQRGHQGCNADDAVEFELFHDMLSQPSGPRHRRIG